MEIKVLQRFINGITECDKILSDIHSKPEFIDRYSPAARDALAGAMIQRKNNLIDQMRNLGVEVDG